jgi:multidrug efflux pump subunit AcrB
MPGRCACCKARRRNSAATAGVVDIDDGTEADAGENRVAVDRGKAALLGVAQREIVAAVRLALAGDGITPLFTGTSKFEVPIRVGIPPEEQTRVERLLQLRVRTDRGDLIPLSELVHPLRTVREKAIHHKNLLPVVYVTGDMAGEIDSPLYGMFAMRGRVSGMALEEGGVLGEYFIRQPSDRYAGYAIKWDGEWQVTYETFRDMGIAYAVGLILIYLLVVAQFRSYLTPLVIMAPIPLTVIGVMPGHALLGAQFTATSMIGMIALAGIIVRNSILLVDFVNLEVSAGAGFPGGDRACRRDPRQADHPHRPCGNARRAVHTRRPDLQRARGVAHLRHPGLHAAHAGGDPGAVLRGELEKISRARPAQ